METIDVPLRGLMSADGTLLDFEWAWLKCAPSTDFGRPERALFLMTNSPWLKTGGAIIAPRLFGRTFYDEKIVLYDVYGRADLVRKSAPALFVLEFERWDYAQNWLGMVWE